MGNWLNLGARRSIRASPALGLPRPARLRPVPARRPTAGQLSAALPAGGLSGARLHRRSRAISRSGHVRPCLRCHPCPDYWRRKEPIGAIVLIGLGLLFLLGQISDHLPRPLIFEFTWPLTADRAGRLADRSPARRFARRFQMSRYIMIRRLRGPAFLLLIGALRCCTRRDLGELGHRSCRCC